LAILAGRFGHFGWAIWPFWPGDLAISAGRSGHFTYAIWSFHPVMCGESRVAVRDSQSAISNQQSAM
jgi:hypothetical protein